MIKRQDQNLEWRSFLSHITGVKFKSQFDSDLVCLRKVSKKDPQTKLSRSLKWPRKRFNSSDRPKRLLVCLVIQTKMSVSRPNIESWQNTRQYLPNMSLAKYKVTLTKIYANAGNKSGNPGQISCKPWPNIRQFQLNIRQFHPNIRQSHPNIRWSRPNIVQSQSNIRQSRPKSKPLWLKIWQFLVTLLVVWITVMLSLGTERAQILVVWSHFCPP